MAKVHVEVTQEDIDRGIPEDGSRCPIAHAFRRAWGRKTEFAVDYESIEIYSLCTESVQLPKEARDFVTSFDDGAGGQPFAFDIDVPEEDEELP